VSWTIRRRVPLSWNRSSSISLVVRHRFGSVQPPDASRWGSNIMRIAVLQHVEFEGPAAVADWAVEHGFPLRLFHLYRDATLPSLADFDMLTVMGGPMSANDEAQLGWLGPEITLVREAIATEKTLLGICLGAQIIAKALGARVYPGSTKEIGWFPIQRTGSHPLFDGLPDSFTPFHWHGETFNLPHEGKLFAKSEITETQAFAVGHRVLGLQFHMEATEESVRALLKGADHEVGHGVFEQQPAAIFASINQCVSLRPLLDTVLDRLTGFAAES
jgi:GMP synthase-like glutamine amidotransferase